MMKSGRDCLHPHPNMIGVNDLVILRQHRICLAYQDQRKRDGMCGTDPTTHWAPRDGRRKQSAIGKLTTAAIGSRLVRRKKFSPLSYRRISKCSLELPGSYPPISILMSVNLISGARSAVHRSMNSDGARKTCEPSRSVAIAALFLLTN